MGLFKVADSIGKSTMRDFKQAYFGRPGENKQFQALRRGKVERMSRVDLFAASREMSTRVADYMRIKVWNVTIKARLDKAIKDGKARIETLEGLAKDTGKDYSEAIADIEQVVEDAKANYAKLLEEGEKFELTENDKEFYANYKNEGMANEAAIVKWFKKYELELEAEDELVVDLASAIAGARKLSGRGIVRANAEQFTDNVRTKSDVMTVFYGRLSERMLEAGTLKPEAIPEDVRAFYAPQKKNKK